MVVCGGPVCVRRSPSVTAPPLQGLLKQAEESESGEESIKRPPKRHKKPKERRRRKESDSLAARTHAGGSLDNIGGEKAQAAAAARQRGVAGRTREGEARPALSELCELSATGLDWSGLSFNPVFPD